MQSNAKTVEQYLSSLPKDRKESITKVRHVILKNLPKGYEETMQYGMISYIIPFEKYPDTYNNQPLVYVALASQKNHMAIYLMNIYSDSKTKKWFEEEYKKSGKRYDCGKSCVRFRKLQDLPLNLIGKAVNKTSVNEYIKFYENSRHFRNK